MVRRNSRKLGDKTLSLCSDTRDTLTLENHLIFLLFENSFVLNLKCRWVNFMCSRESDEVNGNKICVKSRWMGVVKSRMRRCLCLCLCFQPLSFSLFLCCEEEEVEGGCEEEDAVLYSAAPPARAIRPYGAGPSSLLIIDWEKNPAHPCPLPSPPGPWGQHRLAILMPSAGN